MIQSVHAERTVRHVLTECSQSRELRRTIWADEVRKAGYNWIEFCTILTIPAYPKKAAGFVQKTGLLGQSQGLHWANTT